MTANGQADRWVEAARASGASTVRAIVPADTTRLAAWALDVLPSWYDGHRAGATVVEQNIRSLGVDELGLYTLSRIGLMLEDSRGNPVAGAFVTDKRGGACKIVSILVAPDRSEKLAYASLMADTCLGAAKRLG